MHWLQLTMITTALKRFLISTVLLAGLACVCPSAAQDDTTRRPGIVPDHLKVQYAGGIGFFSVAAGYSTRDGKVDGDLYYGYVPKSAGGLYIHALTGKFTYSPIKPLQYGNFRVKPFSTGLFVNYTFGKQYFGFRPENYPYDYYKFPTSLHIGGFVGGEVFREPVRPKPFRHIGVYYELLTFDRLLLSYMNNRNALSLTDIFSLGLGVKLGF